ncbi:MAG: acyltransferase family protein [Candidatus Aquirickettsiella gammari]
MLGTSRFILAILVALSHIDFRIAGLNPGVIAVVCFYLISGYVMTGLLREYFMGVSKIGSFYVDRVLRLFPQYLAILGLTLLWFLTTGKTTSFLQHAPSINELLENLFIIPLNFYMFNGIDQFTAIPPAWSLGAEIQFYLLFPWLLLLRLRWLAFSVGGVFLILASTGNLNTDLFGYRLLPGVLVYFILGSWMFDLKSLPIKLGRYVIAIFCIVLVVWIGLAKGSYINLPYNYETLIGILIGSALLFGLARLPQKAWDNRLGDLSYGVFLNHFLIQWSWLGVPDTLTGMVQYLAVSVILSYLTQRFVEQPVLLWRKKIRQRKITS